MRVESFDPENPTLQLAAKRKPLDVGNDDRMELIKEGLVTEERYNEETRTYEIWARWPLCGEVHRSMTRKGECSRVCRFFKEDCGGFRTEQRRCPQWSLKYPLVATC